MTQAFDSRPIGVFDSGVGGLTVLNALVQRLPEENFIYLGDTARVPYGTKSALTVARYASQVTEALVKRDVKSIVVACNTASALGMDTLQTQFNLPVLGVIDPGCKTALSYSKNNKIGIIGTRSTIASNAYPNRLRHFKPGIMAISLACPLFVPLAEEGWVEHPSTEMIIAETLKPLIGSDIDTLILGCTHYPILKSKIQQFLSDKIHLVDSALALADQLYEQLNHAIQPATKGNKQQLTFLSTDAGERFREVAERFLPGLTVKQVERIDL
ncbi:MAG: glutamate racemase [Magnetococcales bacterium]|nr:glutamate racemase [Magnetococcales bacterium]